MATQSAPAAKDLKPDTPGKHARREDHAHLESLGQMGLVRDESEKKGPVEALFTHGNDSIHEHKPLI